MNRGVYRDTFTDVERGPRTSRAGRRARVLVIAALAAGLGTSGCTIRLEPPEIIPEASRTMVDGLAGVWWVSRDPDGPLASRELVVFAEADEGDLYDMWFLESGIANLAEGAALMVGAALHSELRRNRRSSSLFLLALWGIQEGMAAGYVCAPTPEHQVHHAMRTRTVAVMQTDGWWILEARGIWPMSNLYYAVRPIDDDASRLFVVELDARSHPSGVQAKTPEDLIGLLPAIAAEDIKVPTLFRYESASLDQQLADLAGSPVLLNTSEP